MLLHPLVHDPGMRAAAKVVKSPSCLRIGLRPHRAHLGSRHRGQPRHLLCRESAVRAQLLRLDRRQLVGSCLCRLARGATRCTRRALDPSPLSWRRIHLVTSNPPPVGGPRSARCCRAPRPSSRGRRSSARPGAWTPHPARARACGAACLPSGAELGGLVWRSCSAERVVAAGAGPELAPGRGGTSGCHGPRRAACPRAQRRLLTCQWLLSLPHHASGRRSPPSRSIISPSQYSADSIARMFMMYSFIHISTLRPDCCKIDKSHDTRGDGVQACSPGQNNGLKKGPHVY
eukprot:SAG22_NODE_684_length_7918_cov_6.380356_6_plen_289_part_00